jgi:hypothetical protein
MIYSSPFKLSKFKNLRFFSDEELVQAFRRAWRRRTGRIILKTICKAYSQSPFSKMQNSLKIPVTCKYNAPQ